eukprot:jgi/Botrbrau1/3059/Bobra.0070s0052.2
MGCMTQVCREWKELLDQTDWTSDLWEELIIDYGHEIITAVHTPIEWSDRRPSDEDFRQCFSQTRLSAKRILGFVEKRKHAIRRLVLHNSEGCYMAEDDYVTLHHKHDFSLSHLGVMVGMLYNNLQELRLHGCNDFFSCDAQSIGLVACLPWLRVLHIEDVHGLIKAEAMSNVGRLSQLEELVLTAELGTTATWAVGLEAIPDSWSQLTRLTHLHLRGHVLLGQLPRWLPSLPICHLDLSRCRMLDVSEIGAFTGLTQLALHGMDLREGLSFREETDASPAGRPLPFIWGLTRLEALQLSGNQLAQVPSGISALTSLRFLDLSANRHLQITGRLRGLLGLPHLQFVDFSEVHVEEGATCWSEKKGITMGHVAHLARQLKRRQTNPPAQVLADYDQ